MLFIARGILRTWVPCPYTKWSFEMSLLLLKTFSIITLTIICNIGTVYTSDIYPCSLLQNIVSLPWEALPCLKDQPVTRMPSLQSLHDLYQVSVIVASRLDQLCLLFLPPQIVYLAMSLRVLFHSENLYISFAFMLYKRPHVMESPSLPVLY